MLLREHCRLVANIDCELNLSEPIKNGTVNILIILKVAEQNMEFISLELCDWFDSMLFHPFPDGNDDLYISSS
jgi:hypothetical protein